MINIYEIDEYWWVMMREEVSGNPGKIIFRHLLLKGPYSSGIMWHAGGGA
jgi:hypothetical protein